MLRIILQYYPINTDVGFLQIKQDYIENTPWLIAFFIHVFSSLFALLAGFTQFSKTIRIKHKNIHRTVGMLYVLNVLLITGPAGLIMSFYANGGLSSRIAFVLLSSLWWWFTWQAWLAIRHKNVGRHQAFMLRSYALTLSAITLRCWKMLIANTLHLPPMEIYQIVAWLGFVPNLIMAEVWIRQVWRKR